MANSTLRDLSADTDIGATDVMPKQSVSGALKKITGSNVKAALEVGGGIELSLAGAQTAGAGADTRVQYNNGTARGGDADLVWDNSGKALTVGASTVTAQLKLPASTDASTPTLAFGDGDSGLFEDSDTLFFVAGSLSSVRLDANRIYTPSGGSFINAAASSTNPTLATAQNDTDTGVGLAAADQLSLIAGGVEVLRASESTHDAAMIRTEDFGRAQNAQRNLSAANQDFPNGVIFWLDESANKLYFSVRYSTVETRSGSVDLT